MSIQTLCGDAWLETGCPECRPEMCCKKWRAICRDTGKVVATGRTYLQCSDRALATGIWDQAPGTVAPYYLTTIHNEDATKAQEC